ncbi:peroxide stress protein YaaA [Corynebacterium poyangense]|uniref:Peroxide stress protein YaaA n=1 Tax=Corynebacterium poyangense TaxID=2684405 RepID=A0A7H0SPH0_9CORY|nr:peroxide stress protein YaaA [Corynebacterium poyangense]QNQ90445.1 peroxide stress protein YaaA [Corynebacterium poyangense]
MLIILPPSETKAHGGDGQPLDLSNLHFPELNSIRESLINDLLALEPSAMQQALKLSDRLWPEGEANLELLDSPTMPAIFRYTGVLYDALKAETLSPIAFPRLAIGSALFGVLSAQDPIPHYRLSATNKIPQLDGTSPTLKSRWKPQLSEALDNRHELILDLRSGAYADLGKPRSGISLKVFQERFDGTRYIVSHFNKKYKGVFARCLAEAPEDFCHVDDVIQFADSHGFQVEKYGSNEIHLIVAESES